MAAGFKTATVNSGDVPATQTNFPSYVDLSRLGITTLAEAQSVRVYADSGKTVEWAREIVNAAEMHVKIPSLTSIVAIYVDWDGVSADYSVTDTYGRNNVWSDYEGVWHLEEDPSGTAPQMTDSTGNGNNGTSQGSMTSADLVTAQLSNGLDMDGANDGVSTTNAVDDAVVTNGVYTYSIWIKSDTTSGVGRIFDTSDNNTQGVAIFRNGTTMNFRHGNGSILGASTSFSDTTNFHLLHQRWDNSNVFGYIDGSQVVTFAAASISGSTQNFTIGSRVSSAGQDFNGIIDEARVRATDVGANWIISEYNNQIDEAGFWGTWTDAGGGVTANLSARRQHLMMM